MWETLNLGSMVTPRMRGFSAKGRGEELRVTGGCRCVWSVSEEKSEIVDLWAESVSHFRSAHFDAWATWSVRAAAKV